MSDIHSVIPITTNHAAFRSPAPIEETCTSDSVQIEAPPPPTTRPYSRQRLLIGEEFDVLPVVSNIILRYNKAICYMTYGISSLALIKNLVSLQKQALG
jgi:hypothetical protein